MGRGLPALHGFETGIRAKAKGYSVTNIVDYFTEIQRLVGKLYEVEVERYEEEVLTENRGNLRIRLRF